MVTLPVNILKTIKLCTLNGYNIGELYFNKGVFKNQNSGSLNKGT